MAENTADQWMTVSEVAEHLRLSDAKVYQLAQRGEIPRVKIARRWRFRRADVDAWAAQQSRKGGFWTSGTVLEEVLEQALGENLSAGDTPAGWEPVDRVRPRLQQAFTQLKDTFTRLPLDLLAVELERPYSVPETPHEPQRVRAFVGKLADVLERYEPYNKEIPYRFVYWRYPHPLRIRILGDLDVPDQHPGRFELITRKSAIESAAALAPTTDLLDKQLTYILTRSSAGEFPVKGYSRERVLRDAARVALESTEYSRRFMTPRSFEQLNVDRSVGEELGLPHTDERNIVFLPSFVRRAPIGGTAVFSHKPLPYERLLLFAISAHLIIHRFRTADDWGAVQIAAHEQARWEATVIHIRRLSHDVRKPLDQIRSQVTEFINGIPTTNAETRELLLRVKEQLDVFGSTLASRIGVSTEDLRRQANMDARLVRLADVLDSALWIWEAEAAKGGKTVTRQVKPDHEAKASLPKSLVVEVLSNLVSNAVRFARRNVEVQAGVVTVDNSSHVEFLVKDDGPGMSPEVWSQAFQRGLADGPALSGQGLYLSRFIAKELLSGNLTADAPSGQGLVVRFTFPEIQHEASNV